MAVNTIIYQPLYNYAVGISNDMPIKEEKAVEATELLSKPKA
jgi:hypothetical protein